MTLQQEVTIAVHGFIAAVMALAQEAAVAAVESAMSVGVPTRGRAGALKPRTSVSRAALRREIEASFADEDAGQLIDAADAIVDLRTRRERRSQSDLKAHADRLVTFIERNPGLRVEQINRAMGTERRELALPIRRLVAAGVLRVQGRKRSTKYYVVTDHTHHLRHGSQQSSSTVGA